MKCMSAFQSFCYTEVISSLLFKATDFHEKWQQEHVYSQIKRELYLFFLDINLIFYVHGQPDHVDTWKAVFHDFAVIMTDKKVSIYTGDPKAAFLIEIQLTNS